MARLSTGDRLEKALIDDPDNLSLHAVYADWLMEQGDPRGEFSQVQLALEDAKLAPSRRKKAESRCKELLEAHTRTWLGGLAEFLLDQKDVDDYARQQFGGNTLGFRRGWLSEIHISRLTVAFARALVRAPEIRLLRSLSISHDAVEPAGSYPRGKDNPSRSPNAAVHVLLGCPFLGNLRGFHLGNYGAAGPPCGETAADLVARMPRLESLELDADNLDTKKLFGLKRLKNLRRLFLAQSFDFPLEVLARNSAFKNLTSLTLMPPPNMSSLDERDDASIYLAQVRALFRSRHLDNLTHLTIQQSDMGDVGCQELVRSGKLRHLRELNLEYCRISDEGASTLASSPDLRNVDRLRISGNRLTDAGIKTLRSAGVAQVESHGQFGPDGEYLG
jgi:uncharacterized protein (TIGR02996 family)